MNKLTFIKLLIPIIILSIIGSWFFSITSPRPFQGPEVNSVTCTVSGCNFSVTGPKAMEVINVQLLTTSGLLITNSNPRLAIKHSPMTFSLIYQQAVIPKGTVLNWAVTFTSGSSQGVVTVT